MALTVLALALLSGCASDGGEELGIYTLAEVRSSGERYAAEDVLDTSGTLELKRGGKAVLTLDGAGYKGQWFNEDGVFDLVTNAGVSHGTIGSGVCSFDLLDEGVVYVFLREGAELPADGGLGVSDARENALQQAWNGGWYGWWVINSGTGVYDDADGGWWDACARIDLDADGSGTLILWDDSCEAGQTIAQAYVQASADLTTNGRLVSTDGSFFDCALDGADAWYIDAAPSSAMPYSDMICISGVYTDPENGENTFVYSIYLRPWGETWDDVRADNEELMPYSYDDWYLPLIEAGASMPDAIGGNPA